MLDKEKVLNDEKTILEVGNMFCDLFIQFQNKYQKNFKEIINLCTTDPEFIQLKKDHIKLDKRFKSLNAS